MQQADELSPIFNLSGDARVHVFRRRFTASAELGEMEVDAYVVTSKRYLVVLDTLLCPEDAAAMMKYMRQELHGRKLLVFNSHADWDHIWGNSYFTGSHAAPIIAHDACLLRVQSSEAGHELATFRASDPLFRTVVLTPPTITFSHHLTIHGGDLTIHLLHAPGHERDHCAIWLPELRLLLAFDALELPLPLLNTPGGVPQMFSTLEQFRALHPTRVLCSHSRTNSSDIIDANLTYLRTLEQRCRAFLRAHPHLRTEALLDIAEAIGYSFDEVVENQSTLPNRNFYSQAHNENIRHVIRWIRDDALPAQ